MSNKTPLNDELLDQVSGGTKFDYIVQTETTLAKVASDNHIPVELLAKWNNLPVDAKVSQGATLTFKF